MLLEGGKRIASSYSSTLEATVTLFKVDKVEPFRDWDDTLVRSWHLIGAVQLQGAGPTLKLPFSVKLIFIGERENQIRTKDFKVLGAAAIPNYLEDFMRGILRGYYQSLAKTGQEPKVR